MKPTLDQIVANKRQELEAIRLWSSFRPEPLPAQGRFYKALQEKGVKLICEIKPSSPSAGVLQSAPDIDQIVSVYSRYAMGISVLTDARYFGGSLELLAQVSSMADAPPTLCKDFILDPVQIVAARQAGAEAVLLIVKILAPDQLALLATEIRCWGMTPIIEIQNEAELETLLTVGQPETDIALINNRDLSTFTIDFATTEQLVPLLPSGWQVISASGIDNQEDIKRLKPYTTCFLIGSALMRSKEPEALLKGLHTSSIILVD